MRAICVAANMAAADSKPGGQRSPAPGRGWFGRCHRRSWNPPGTGKPVAVKKKGDAADGHAVPGAAGFHGPVQIVRNVNGCLHGPPVYIVLWVCQPVIHHLAVSGRIAFRRAWRKASPCRPREISPAPARRAIASARRAIASACRAIASACQSEAPQPIGFSNRRPGNMRKSLSAEQRTRPCSMAVAASCASATSLWFIPGKESNPARMAL